MSEVDMAVIKPEMMKSYIWLQTADGSIQQVEQEVAMFCPLICQEVIQKGMGSSKNYAISLPQRVNPAMLSLILDYCRFHQVPGSSNKERKSFDEKFIRMDTKRLCELTSAADSLQLKPLVDLTSRALARIIEGKTPEEIREIFHLPDDLTEEEKLEPLKNTTDDPRIRLLNRLYAKKRKELKEREKLKNVESEEERVDERSVDDLLQFINGGERDSKGTKSSKNKKKNQRKKDQLKDTCPIESIKTDKQESNGLNFVCHSAEVGNKFSTDLGETSNMQNMEDGIFVRKVDFDDVDIDDEIDPALKEKLDREVEDFARRLNSDWPERMQEILSLGHDMKPLRHSTKGNGTIRRYAKDQIRSGNDFVPSDQPNGWNNFDQMLTEGVCGIYRSRYFCYFGSTLKELSFCKPVWPYCQSLYQLALRGNFLPLNTETLRGEEKCCLAHILCATMILFFFFFFSFSQDLYTFSIHCCFGKFCRTCNACTNAGWSCHGPINALCLGCM
ncbi:SKP1-like protein 21 isoform X1 [Citrus sinensis]|uniref:SKP1-like protein 21 isoform X1 n=2 Tax=Citrus sinensis TaxID=2711 RepID=UPI0003D74CE0|nr:SKP1-like protein 21 isoform X1 [Citrus sinensis]XP_015389744.1 SKP1-like protein 21 isoform X1 [Citrus sinensis]XP_024948391.1 SKP1-like protein 21 isoform X1 [Citrus sinensis]XP_024948392.1 SKP1-like protein 21 isoform X1 [Citrus sinensis]XP_052292597.1 SKP1-like protein 21 isoform X1 [Citrus sinensis]XP_052292598.1 SKP1-like protein 21 isoform X1 [Citrus sinensis]XP_052292599.1 SKP1-like protein 21 isoform X1 [Citrus sinensis]XP_052292600.1 SKP1-like protein 21 isoform X1 [Citrus sinen